MWTNNVRNMYTVALGIVKIFWNFAFHKIPNDQRLQHHFIRVQLYKTNHTFLLPVAWVLHSLFG